MLTQGGIAFAAEYTPGDLPGHYRFDFAVFRQGKLAYLIAYDGVLHTTYSGRGWDTEARFLRTQASDGLKNAYCARKGIPPAAHSHTQYALLSRSDLVLETSPFRLSPPGPGGMRRDHSRNRQAMARGEVVGEMGHVPPPIAVRARRRRGRGTGPGTGRPTAGASRWWWRPSPPGGRPRRSGRGCRRRWQKPMQADPSRVPAQPPGRSAGGSPHQEEQGAKTLVPPRKPLDADEEQPAEEGH